MNIRRTSKTSYVVLEGTLDDVAAHLEARGWARHPARSPHEHSRWRYGDRALIIIYLSGKLLSQGREPHLALDAFRGYVSGSIWL